MKDLLQVILKNQNDGKILILNVYKKYNFLFNKFVGLYLIEELR